MSCFPVSKRASRISRPTPPEPPASAIRTMAVICLCVCASSLALWLVSSFGISSIIKSLFYLVSNVLEPHTLGPTTVQASFLTTLQDYSIMHGLLLGPCDFDPGSAYPSSIRTAGYVGSADLRLKSKLHVEKCPTNHPQPYGTTPDKGLRRYAVRHCQRHYQED